ncbi:MAG TPA: copper homeostasis protein CutC [Pseudonocardiaceae bacterium]|jgi:copper homeostasis protein|nr:copper homeostasis protein CutC [Pseudonocardiaceae bacterium]
MKLELSVDTLAGVLAAHRLGADRVELCTAAGDGGLTPSHGLIAVAVRHCPNVHVLIRPRCGDFTYTPTEIDAMVEDAAHAVALGAAGVVSGVLTADGKVDKVATAAMVGVANHFTFDRAIDVCADPLDAVDVLRDVGVRRVLTSGAARTAVEGAHLIDELVLRAGPDLAVMAGGGVRPDNVQALIRATGVRDIHAGPRRGVQGRPSATKVSFASAANGMDRYELDERVATELCALVHGFG